MVYFHFSSCFHNEMPFFKIFNHLQVLKFDLEKAGFLASAPYLSRFICGFMFGSISDYLIKHKLLTVTTIRKSFSLFCKFFCFFVLDLFYSKYFYWNLLIHFGLAHVLPGLLLFSIRFVNDNPIHCVILITIAMGFNGATTVVNLANSLDLAPNYAATLSSIINTFATLGGIIAPMVVTYFTREHVSVKFFRLYVY